MEVFGLIKMLNSLLPKGENSAEETGNAPPPPASEPTPPLPPPTEKPNACLDFFNAHERRRKRK